MKNLILTGFMASGKTTIGKIAAQLLQFTFIDTDEFIEKKEARTINAIFEKNGEQYFRRIETQILQELASSQNTVIATGGGVILHPENIDILRKNGIIFNLAPDFCVIQNRLEEASRTRPLLKNQDIKQIKKRFDDRKPLYENCDEQMVIHGDKTPAQYADELVRCYKQLTKDKK